MGNIDILRPEYWSKSKAFLLPLTGITRTGRYEVETFLFWDDFSIENFNLIVKYTYDDYEKFVDYCRKVIFPIWDRNGYLVESHDFGNETVFVLDLSEWALDIEMFLAGKYSKMSEEAKTTIKKYHMFFEKGIAVIEIEMSATLEPLKEYEILNNMNALEYASEHYGFSLTELQKIGEIGSIYNRDKETLNYISAKVAEKE